jgi:hypothetical protein
VEVGCISSFHPLLYLEFTVVAERLVEIGKPTFAIIVITLIYRTRDIVIIVAIL